MTVPTVHVDPELKTYGTEHQARVVDAINATGSTHAAAKLLGVNQSNVSRMLARLREVAAHRGYATGKDAEPLPGLDGQLSTIERLKGRSAYIDVATGKATKVWLKTDVKLEHYTKLIAEAIDAHIADLPGREVAPAAPRDYSYDVIPWVQVGDAHIGMLAHAAEVGENFDLKIAKRELMGAIDQLVDEMPACKRVVLNDLGDGTHYENYSATTEASGHALDYDSRFPKMIDVYVDTIIYMIEKLLTKCEVLDCMFNQGNHSRTNDIWIAKLVRKLFGHTGRVNVIPNESVFIGYRMGKTLVMVHHSDKCKADKLPAVMAKDFAKDWGETEFHYIDVGHVHHRRVALDENGAVVESWNHLAAADKYAHDGGWRSSKSISVVLRSRTYGEIGRRTLSIQELRDRLYGAGHKVQTTKPAFVA